MLLNSSDKQIISLSFVLEFRYLNASEMTNKIFAVADSSTILLLLLFYTCLSILTVLFLFLPSSVVCFVARRRRFGIL